MTLGLYNSYDPVKFHEAHRRALARAGPIALSCDANLATFGFPYEKDLRTPTDIVDWVSGTTSIGEGGKFLTVLAEKGRFQVFPFPDRGFPPQLGIPVITTKKPEEKKGISAREIARMLKEGRSVLLLFGLGPRGLDKKLFGIGKYHVDITGKGYSLETCTALGAVPSSIRAYLDSI